MTDDVLKVLARAERLLLQSNLARDRLERTLRLNGFTYTDGDDTWKPPPRTVQLSEHELDVLCFALGTLLADDFLGNDFRRPASCLVEILRRAGVELDSPLLALLNESSP